MNTLLITPLHAWHRANGARMVPFAGWDMPVQYQSILEEHAHTRSLASVFDISHMGEFLLDGPGASAALSAVVTHDIATMRPGRCRYGFLLNDQGGILDDLIIYRLAEEKFLLVVNAACTDSDFTWIGNHLPPGLSFTNQSLAIAKIDLQGPATYDVLTRIMPEDWTTLGYFAFRETLFQDVQILVSRTGYTGELGYEFYLPWETALDLWDALVADVVVRPAGLGARDTLRLEAGLPLYGQDLDATHTPVEAGYASILQSPVAFVGKAALQNVRTRLIGLRIDGRRSARHNDPVYLDDELAGVVTSGSFAPSLGYCVALAYVRADMATQETFIIQGQKTMLTARRVNTPFYAQGTARRKHI